MKFLDLFSGIGGFRLGLEMAGHECVGHCEIDKFANKSYIAMHEPKESEWFAEDITKVRTDELPGADIWTFGFPCQDISIAGNQKGFGGHRSSLFFAVTKLIRELEEENRPSILFIENVKNLLSVNRGLDFLRLQIELDEIGYDAEWDILNSKHFGVPQNRERLFIIGHLRGRGTRKVFPIRQRDKGCNQSQKDEEEIHETALCLTAKGQSNWTGSFINVVGNLDRTRIRRLTPKECFRLQGFPDEYFERAKAVNSDTQLWKQAGNTVTVNVIYEIARRF